MLMKSGKVEHEVVVDSSCNDVVIDLAMYIFQISLCRCKLEIQIFEDMENSDSSNFLQNRFLISAFILMLLCIKGQYKFQIFSTKQHQCPSNLVYICNGAFRKDL